MGSESTPPLLFTSLVLTTVKPIERTAHVERIDPTDTDMTLVDIYAPTLFAYRSADNSDSLYEEMVNRIREGLRKVLVPFFPWAGRWVAIPGGRGRQLLCNDVGIPFIEARVDKDLDSVVGFSAEFQPVPELQGYSVLGLNDRNMSQLMLPDGLPCAFVQVTRFNCGGLVLCVTFNHMHADGKSFFHFMTAWSDISRTDKTNMILDHNRAATQKSSSESVMILDHNWAAPQKSSSESVPVDTSSDVPIVRSPKVWITKSYEVNASAIASLKNEVKKSADGAYVSTMDCVLAHQCKTLSSLPFSITSGKEIGVLTIVEGRTRIHDPPVPNLLGNVFATMRAPNISSAELSKMPLSTVARKIRDKINTTSRETWLSPERAAEVMDVFVHEEFPWVQSSWSSFPTYEIDFGFGRPFFSPGPNAVFPHPTMSGLTNVGPPTPGVSSSAAFIQMLTTPQIVEALEQLPDFLPFFLPKKNGHPRTLDDRANSFQFPVDLPNDLICAI